MNEPISPADSASTIQPSIPEGWDQMITAAVAEPDAIKSNFRITRAHYLLSKALRQAIGEDCGANFHSWAVWGSRKAGVTIRQEDRDQASRDATVVAGIVGGLTGLFVGWLAAESTGLPTSVSILLWFVTGAIAGGYSGLKLADYTRRSASEIVLEGNRIVLDDIGRVTARYLQYVAQVGHADASPSIDDFLQQLRQGATEHGGQELLARAFQHYEIARTATDDELRHQATYFANCLAILHEHIRLQPYIRRSLPFLIKKCVTQRLMTFSVGSQSLSVHEDIPPLHDAVFPVSLQKLKIDELKTFLTGPDGWDISRDGLRNTRTRDWTVLRQRMGYVVNLFRSRHLHSDVVAAPYTPEQLADIERGMTPQRPW